MCQGLLYAFCYHLDGLLNPDAEDVVEVDACQLQAVHISQPAAPASADPDQATTCMQPPEIRHTLCDLLPGLLHHRCSYIFFRKSSIAIANIATAALQCLLCPQSMV